MNEKSQALCTLELKGVVPPSTGPKSPRRLRRRQSADTKIIKIDGGSSTEGNLSLRIYVPEGYHFSKEARSKFDVEIEAGNAVTIKPSDGILDSDGYAHFHFKRTLTSPVLGRINCKVYYCKEDEVCLYESLAFDVFFNEAVAESPQTEVRLVFTVQPKTSVSSKVPAFIS